MTAEPEASALDDPPRVAGESPEPEPESVPRFVVVTFVIGIGLLVLCGMAVVVGLVFGLL